MWKSLVALVVLLAAALLVFAIWPQIDTQTSRLFYGPTGFMGYSPPQRAVRDFFRVFPFVVLGVLIILYGLRHYGIAVPYAPSGRGLFFVVATMIIGPGLIVNLGFKDHAHRPRPVQTVEFGGRFQFRPWYRFDGECKKNCSFPSGEGSEGFWMAAPATLAPPPLRGWAIAGALAFGIATSVLRVAYGGHFLSDTVVAALVMLIIVQAARMLLFGDSDPS